MTMRTIKAWTWEGRLGPRYTFPEGTLVEDLKDGMGRPCYVIAGPAPADMTTFDAHDFNHSGAHVPADIVVTDSTYRDAQTVSDEELQAASDHLDKMVAEQESVEDYDSHLRDVIDEWLEPHNGRGDHGAAAALFSLPGIYEALSDVTEFHNEAVARCMPDQLDDGQPDDLQEHGDFAQDDLPEASEMIGADE